MLEVFKGQRPDITPAQTVAVLLAGVPVLSNLLHAFGMFAMSAAQQAALSDSIEWGGIAAGLLLLGDTGIRAARNSADSKVQAAALVPVPAPAQAGVAGAVVAPHDVQDLAMSATPLDPMDEATIDDLPDDDTEFASPPPDESNVPVQPSQAGLTDAAP